MIKSINAADQKDESGPVLNVVFKPDPNLYPDPASAVLFGHVYLSAIVDPSAALDLVNKLGLWNEPCRSSPTSEVPVQGKAFG